MADFTLIERDQAPKIATTPAQKRQLEYEEYVRQMAESGKVGRFEPEKGERLTSIKQRLSWAAKRLRNEGYEVYVTTGDRDGLVYASATKTREGESKS